MPRLTRVACIAATLLWSGQVQATSLIAPLIPGNTTDIVWVSATNAPGVVSGLGTSDITLDGNSPWAGASVNLVPEPATLALVVFGIGALALARRRRVARGAGLLLALGAIFLGDSARATSLSAPLIPGNTTDIIWVSATNLAGVFSGLGTSKIGLDGSPNTLTLAVVQTVDTAASLGGIFGALAFDTDRGDELDLGPAAPTEFEIGFFQPFTRGYDDPIIAPPTRDSTLGGQSGYALGLEAINVGVGFMIAGPSGMTFTAFTVTFTVNAGNLADDSADVFWGPFGTGNAIGTDGGALIYDATRPAWAGASVCLDTPDCVVPEPATLALVALGVGALASRRKTLHAVERLPQEPETLVP